MSFLYPIFRSQTPLRYYSHQVCNICKASLCYVASCYGNEHIKHLSEYSNIVNMCNFKEKLTKYTGYYKSPDEINKFKIRIRLKEELPDSSSIKDDDWYTQEFRWQEKYFSKFEREFYSDAKNCGSDLSMVYHEKIVNREITDDSIFFTYIDRDDYNIEEKSVNKTNLERMMENIDLNLDCKSQNGYELQESVLHAMENKIIPNNMEKMYILVDLGDFIDDVWIKNEFILCTLKYDIVSKTLSVYPDFTTTKPYVLKIQGESLKYVYYYIENSSENVPASEEFKELDIMRKISDTKVSFIKEMTADDFVIPPKNKLFVYLFFDILSAQGFEYNDLYLQYFVDLPEHWSSNDLDNLEGLTQTGHTKNDQGVVHFGHNFDLVLEYDIQSLQETKTPKSPCIYFQMISEASWDRYRTEGLAYQNLPVSRPGCYLYNLSCYRFDPSGHSGKLRRYFIGDAYNYKDPRWIGLPNAECENGTFNKFGVKTIGTGQLQIRLNVIHQSQAFLKEFNEGGDVREKFIYEKLNSSSLIRSVNQVLVAFKKARRKMYEVKKQL